MYVCACMLKFNVGHLPLPFSTLLFEARSLTEPRSPFHLAWLAKTFRNPPVPISIFKDFELVESCLFSDEGHVEGKHVVTCVVSEVELIELWQM